MQAGFEPSIGERIRRLRQRLGLSQVDLAARLGVSNVTVNRWERGRAQPVRAIVERLSRVEREGIEAFDRPMPARGGALPYPVTSLLGRRSEIALVAELVQTRRIVTLIGPAGTGKTRLAIEVGHTLANMYQDGVWFVDLAPLTDEAAVPDTVAGALGLRESSRQTPAECVAAYCGERSLLLIFDNCEHMIPACARLIAALTRRSPGSRVLATSRAPLGLTGETVSPVPPLAPPEAAALFVERARERRADFGPDDRQGAAIAEICQRLDGLPLAIELAAARVSVLSATQIAERLDRRFDLLRQEGSGEPRRHALDAAIAWSYDLLSSEERVLFRRLGVFSGTFDIGAVEAVIGNSAPSSPPSPDEWRELTGGPEQSALELVDRLVRQSMLAVVDPTVVGARYRLLESLAEFARIRLQVAGERVETARRHAEHYLSLAKRAATELRGPDQAWWLAILDREHDNLLAALDWAVGSAEAPLALALAATLWPYWQRRARFREGVRWVEAALAIAGTIATEHRADALNGAATLRARLGDHDAAIERAAEALTLAVQLGNRAGEARALDTSGLIAQRQGRLDEATGLHERALAIWRELDDRPGAVGSLTYLGQLANVRGDHHAAERSYAEAWSSIQGFGDLDVESALLVDLGDVAARTGRPSLATGYYERALALARDLGVPDRMAAILANLAEVRLTTGAVEPAIAQVSEAIERYRELGNRAHLADALYVKGAALTAARRRSEALATLREALAIYALLGNEVYAAQTIEAMAGVVIAIGDSEMAARWLGGAEAIRARAGVGPYPLFDHDGVVAAVSAALGETQMADAWQRGATLSPVQLILEALHCDEPTPAPTAPVADGGQLPSLLTARQRDVLRLVAAGASNREIAASLGISERTVERHLTAIYTVLEVERRSGAVVFAVTHGLLDSPRD